MTTQTLQSEELTRVVIVVAGTNLTVRGWNRPEIRVQFSGEEPVDRKGDVLELSFSQDGLVWLPHDLPLEIETVGKDCLLKGVDAPLRIKTVGGDFTARDVGPLSISSVGRDLTVKRVRGDLAVESIGKDCLVYDIDGQISASGIGKDLIAKECGGGIEAEAGKDIHLSFSPVPWQAYDLRAGGDIRVRVPEDANADLTLESDIASIKLLIGEETETFSEKEVTYQLGEGGASLKLSARKELLVTAGSGRFIPDLGFELDFADDLGRILEDISVNTSRQLASLEDQLNKQLADLPGTLESAGVTDEKIREIQAKVEQAHERASQKIQEATQKAQHKMEQTLADIQEQKQEPEEVDLEEFFSGIDQTTGRVSEEERLMILRMLQEKKITAEQADELLSALEKRGRS
jgi:hypothetical protein